MKGELSGTKLGNADVSDTNNDVNENEINKNIDNDMSDNPDEWSEPDVDNDHESTEESADADDPDNWSDPEDTKDADMNENHEALTNDKETNDGADDPDEWNDPESEGEVDSDAEDTPEEKYPCKKEIDGQTYYYDDNGELYRVGNDLLPNHEYEINGYKYKTDSLGRIISAEGRLRLKDREGRLNIRDSIEAIGKGDEKEGDDRGHLIGDQFDGSNGLENMIPQDAEINEKDFRKFENELANAVKEGKEVYVKVEPIYEGDSHRPTAIVVTYTIDGKENVRVFPNSKE